MDYTNEQTFKPGDRVELHPGCDLWMRGAKFGDVLAVFRSGNVSVKVDNVTGPKTFGPGRLRHV